MSGGAAARGPLPSCATASATESAPATAAASQPATEPATQPATNGPLRLNFRDAPLNTVLQYLSEATGLIILETTKVSGRITVTSRQPVSTAEAVALLDTVLKEKGYTALRNGRILRIIPIADAA